MKKIIIPISALLVTGFAQAQLNTAENYVYSKSYLDYNGTTPTKTAESVQYFDGLGRPKQVINIKASPSNKDVVTKIVYDQFGRQTLDYLPVPQTGTQNGGIYTDPLANAANTPYGSEKIYAEKQLENSPLDRILGQKQVGTAWDNKPVQFGYDANIDGEVKKYITTLDQTTFKSSFPTSTTYYGANQLYKNTVTDEDGNKTIEFKNTKGQVILVRKMLTATESADTYYVYNDFNQLSYVIPPLASVMATLDQTSLDNLCYQYTYDGKNRLVEKKVPGKEKEYMVYDKADRLVATQDANLRSASTWHVTKYDKFGRVAYTGLMPLPGKTREWLQDITNLYVITENRDAQGFTMSGMQIYYTNSLYQQIETILSVNYYDTYPTGTPAFTSTIPNQSVVLTDNMSSELSTKGLPLASYVKNIEDDNWTKSYNYYDTRGRVIATHSINHLGGYTKTESELDFAGLAKQSITYHKRLSTDTERVITETFEYDNQNRLKVHKHKVDNNAEEILAQNEYNELSQLSSKLVGGTALGSGLQEINYAYNIRGWMTQINDPANLGTTDLFGYKINYNQVQGLAFPNSDFPNLEVKPKYNGNIAEVSWKTATIPGDNLRRYGYVYDGLNRLQAGFYQKDTNPSAQEYFEKLDYDLNGNITNLKRSEGLLTGSTTAMTIDDLSYSYTGNRLNSVTDLSGQYNGYPDTSGNTIPYDLNGNMTSHVDKGILGIDYNFLNLPSSLLFNAGLSTRTGILRNNTSYLYRADGVKVKKTYKFAPYDPPGTATQLSTEITDYLDGFQYKGSAESGPKGSTVFVTALQFYPTAEGYYDFVKNKYIYNYTDHLGNVRLSYFNNGTAIEVLEENNYYPFGLKHEGYNPTAGNSSYQYKYNGKELQTDSGMYDYGARFYMPDLGRWGVVDPLAEKYNSLSSYNYTLNNPIRYVDPDGRDGGITGKGTKDDPFIVTANYYYYGLTKEQKQGLTASISGYNNGGNAREIETKDGKIYAKFNLSAVESESMDAAKASAKGDKIENSDGTITRLGNYISNGTVEGTATAEADRMGLVSDANKVMAYPGMNYAGKFESDFNHEIGHNLGGVHGDPGQMMDPYDNINITISGSNKTTTFKGSPITNDAIRAIIGRANMTTLNSKGNVTNYNIVDSKYLTPTENTTVKNMSPDGSNGRLKSIQK
ncbi:RHS repeat-associated core domain-containing protein [Chryseobacterium sp. RG1]|uniref:RHS repeat-associated core domain-containing protein n=1 Tax=Chryseobacterium tagetis TaxID=2801334 RepID=A0ABS7ZWS8_9FLAO|nr:DUF6443 domain-containing protein [Chryseobacterium tagetis]MCA6066187.1 RHS repeat-associated core domain-containing protein [Chryseobacterium tagetis]